MVMVLVVAVVAVVGVLVVGGGARQPHGNQGLLIGNAAGGGRARWW